MFLYLKRVSVSAFAWMYASAIPLVAQQKIYSAQAWNRSTQEAVTHLSEQRSLMTSEPQIYAAIAHRVPRANIIYINLANTFKSGSFLEENMMKAVSSTGEKTNPTIIPKKLETNPYSAQVVSESIP